MNPFQVIERLDVRSPLILEILIRVVLAVMC